MAVNYLPILGKVETINHLDQSAETGISSGCENQETHADVDE